MPSLVELVGIGGFVLGCGNLAYTYKSYQSTKYQARVDKVLTEVRAIFTLCCETATYKGKRAKHVMEKALARANSLSELCVTELELGSIITDEILAKPLTNFYKTCLVEDLVASSHSLAGDDEVLLAMHEANVTLVRAVKKAAFKQWKFKVS